MQGNDALYPFVTINEPFFDFIKRFLAKSIRSSSPPELIKSKKRTKYQLTNNNNPFPIPRT